MSNAPLIARHRVSGFTSVWSLADRGLPNHLIAFNTRSRKSVLLTTDDWKAINEGRSVGRGSVEDRAIGQLLKSGHIVDTHADEFQSWREQFENERRAPPAIFPLLTVTTACNVGCTYCYESGVSYKNMGPEVVTAVLAWMRERVVVDGVKEINAGLFGGEPLLVPNVLFSLMEGFRSLSDQTGVTGSFYSSSNGILLTNTLASRLAKLGLAQIQISLDGSPAMHEVRRPLKSGAAAFSKVVEGIDIAIDNIPSVTIKINFDRQNLRDAVFVLDEIVKRKWSNSVSVKLEAIAHQFPNSRVSHDARHVIEPTSPAMANAYAYLRRACAEREISVTDDTAHTTPCMFTSEHGVIIGPDGSIYKCISLVGRTEFAVGNVLNDDYAGLEYARQMSVDDKLAPCLAERCKFLPVCAGGCAYESAVRTGEVMKRFCAYDYLERHHYLRQVERHGELIRQLGGAAVSPSEVDAESRSGGVAEHPLQFFPVRPAISPARNSLG